MPDISLDLCTAVRQGKLEHIRVGRFNRCARALAFALAVAAEGEKASRREAQLLSCNRISIAQASVSDCPKGIDTGDRTSFDFC